jgi:hypothetical protein
LHFPIDDLIFTIHFMKKIVILFLLFPNLLLAQLNLSGKVIDATTKLPIAFVNLENFRAKTGTQTNQDGVFSLNLPSGKQSDTLKISCVGYLDKSITNLATAENLSYELTPVVFQLNEVKVGKTKYEERQIGVIDISGQKIIYFNQSIQTPGSQRAVLIKNDGSIGYLKRLHFFMGKDMYEAPFRVHIYENKDNNPGEDLLNKSLELTAKKKNSWNEFDVAAYNIPIPEQGFWVAIEWIANEKYAKLNKPLNIIDEKGKLVKGKSTFTYYGPEIVQKFDSNSGLTFQKRLAGKWEKLKGRISSDKTKTLREVYIDLLIKATVSIAQ